MKREFVMSDEQLEFIVKACEPLEGTDEPDAEFVGRAWDLIGKQLGFDGRTCEPIIGKDEHYFTAEELPTMNELRAESEQAKIAERREGNEE